MSEGAHLPPWWGEVYLDLGRELTWVFAADRTDRDGWDVSPPSPPQSPAPNHPFPSTQFTLPPYGAFFSAKALVPLTEEINHVELGEVAGSPCLYISIIGVTYPMG